METSSDPLSVILHQTTRVPLWVHPCFWSKVHLRLLHAEGFDKNKTRSLSQVVGNPILIKRKGVYGPERWPRSEERQQALGTGFEGVDGRHNSFIPDEDTRKVFSTWLCFIEEDLRDAKLNHKPPHFSIPHINTLPIQFGPAVVDVNCEICLQPFPTRSEKTINFPIVAVWSLDKDYYPFQMRSPGAREWEIEEFYARRHRYASKNAELLALLIAMAQKQAEALRKDRFDGTDVSGDERLSVFHPVVMVLSGTRVRFVTSRIPRTYLESLENLSKPFGDKIIVEQTRWFDLVKRNMLYRKRMAWRNVEKISLALSALVNNYIALLPLFAKRKPLAPGEEMESLSWRMVNESAPCENVKANLSGHYKWDTKDTPFVKRHRKTFRRALPSP